MSRLGTIARRSFLIGSAAIAGGVAFGWYQYRKPLPNPIAGEGLAALNPYVLIDQDGVTVITPRAEMGQGVHSTLAALVAEEMDLAWDQVRVQHGPPGKAYYNGAAMAEGVPFRPTDESWLAETLREAMDIPAKFMGMQLTGGSSSMPDHFERMRAAGALARQALVQAAAQRLGVGTETLKTEGGAVVTADGTRIPYPELAVEAAALDLTDAPALRPQAEWKLLGRDLPRLDMVAKSTGTEAYAIDMRLPGMKFATVRANPAPEGGLVSLDSTAAEKLPGVIKIISLPGAFAVVAETTWAAFQAADAVVPQWGPAVHAPTSEEMEKQLLASFTEDALESTPRDDGDAETALAGGADFEADYVVPYLAHAPMEPQGAAALLENGKLSVWAGTQFPTMARSHAAEVAELEETAVDIHTLPMGGAFGRRGEIDVIRQVAAIAKEMPGTPVLLTWSREEDMTHDMLRPMAAGRIKAKLKDGMVEALDFQTAAGSLMASFFGRIGLPALGPDSTILQGAWEQPYALPNFRARGYRAPAGVPIGFWRSVGASQNAFFLDSALDEMAHQAGVDPMVFRMRQMDHAPSIKVMEAVAEMSGWGNSAPGRAKGVAFSLSFGVPVAEVIEVEETAQGIRLTGAWIAADVGIALNPRNIEAQLSGGMVYGLSAAINGEITFKDGAVVEQNFWDYEPLRLAQCPPIEVRVLAEGGKIRGVGEPGTPPAAPALANAIFALNGQRIRRLPMRHEISFA
ncbi:molybdopterin cofactor-binding domain-containing protein [Neotabrizicola sp. sgz301269]|uniref:xanthine dehydrogenase family protein molybdopterin-binding subunit n=1 Tax=Neotabrizicola sp. sgz301269 TaxID=3276282 RepID=UPI0037705A09